MESTRDVRRLIEKEIKKGSAPLTFDHIDNTYVMPKTAVTYRKPRRLSDEQREAAKKRMNALNSR